LSLSDKSFSISVRGDETSGSGIEKDGEFLSTSKVLEISRISTKGLSACDCPLVIKVVSAFLVNSIFNLFRIRDSYKSNPVE
jgi:hypothetical protein